MTLKEIIKKENAIIEHEQFFQDTHIVFTDDDREDITIEMLYCDDTEIIEESLEISKHNLEYHQQLVDCIQELETFRKQVKNAKEWHNHALDKVDNIITEQLDKSDNQIECQTLRWVLDVLSDLIQ